ncbi:hypothetical protein BH18ACT8_BH18ACT8_04210 [soil metagenome]
MNTTSRVDAAVAELDRLSELTVAEHVDVFEAIHQQLLECLDTRSEAPGASPEPPRR